MIISVFGIFGIYFKQKILEITKTVLDRFFKLSIALPFFQ